MASKKFDLSIVLKLKDGATAGLQKLGGVMKKFGLATAAFTALSVKTTIDFQKEMNMAGAVTNATAEEMKAMKDQAKDLGATTQFSASQAASAMAFMGKAGMKVNEIMAASPKVLQLAAAAQLDMGSAANIVTNIMAGWRMEVGELDRANDVLVNAFTGSNTDLFQLGQGMRNAGATAKVMGFTFEETAAAIGLLGKAGTPGAEAGIALKTMMVKLNALNNPTKKQAFWMAKLGTNFKDAEGKALNLAGVLAEFENAKAAGATDEQIGAAAMGLFDMRAGPKFLALLGQTSAQMISFTESLSKQGTTAKVSAAQMKGMPGAWKSLLSAFEAVQLAIGESPIGDAIEKGMRVAATALRAFSVLLPTLIDDSVKTIKALPDELTAVWDGFFGGLKKMWTDFIGEWNAEWRRVWEGIPKPIRDWLTKDKINPLRKLDVAADPEKLGGMAAIGATMAEGFKRQFAKKSTHNILNFAGMDELVSGLMKPAGSEPPVSLLRPTGPEPIDRTRLTGMQHAAAGMVEMLITVHSKDGSAAEVKVNEKKTKVRIKNSTVGQNFSSMGWIASYYTGQ
jgi:TP901 family phage tail tape measure protein